MRSRQRFIGIGVFRFASGSDNVHLAVPIDWRSALATAQTRKLRFLCGSRNCLVAAISASRRRF